MKLSICVPTYNRALHLRNCLNSIVSNWTDQRRDIEICVSDNGSNDETSQVVEEIEKKIPIRYSRNEKNIGLAGNFIKVVDLAKGEFVWILGDDDLLIPGALEKVVRLIDRYPEVDFFYINSFHLDAEYVFGKSAPFDIKMLPPKMEPFSKCRVDKTIPFFELINPKISFDFLGGMFLAVFRRENWVANVSAVKAEAVADLRTFSNFDNTFPHLKIYTTAFRSSLARLHCQPLSVCLSGVREWAPMYPLVRSVRLIEALEEYRKQGLPLLRYHRCRNYALKYFLPDMASIFIRGEKGGRQYVHICKSVFFNMLYPNCVLSLFLYFYRKLDRIARSTVKKSRYSHIQQQ